MATVFDAPVSPVDSKDAFRIGLFGSLAGYSMDGFAGVFACFLLRYFSLDAEYLSDMRKLEIVVQFGSRPDFPDFDSAVFGRRASNEIGFLAVFEVKGDIV